MKGFRPKPLFTRDVYDNPHRRKERYPRDNVNTWEFHMPIQNEVILEKFHFSKIFVFFLQLRKKSIRNLQGSTVLELNIYFH